MRDIDGSAQRWAAVASAGGHLTQLLVLQERLSHDAPIWVTYPVEQARSLLEGQQVAWAHHPTTKHLPNAVRNYRLARRFFSQNDIGHVVSTGAAVSVPFITHARQLGIPCHYIESATRVDGPSLSGRILQRMGGVQLYRQLGDWGSPRWQRGPCVFDGYSASSRSAPAPQRVVVSLGTHRFAFPALVERLAACFRGSALQVTWQLGSTPDPGNLPGNVVEVLPAEELQAAVANADVVIGHAGVGLTLTALRAGIVPVLVPRRRSRREHTDDHQVQLARELANLGLGIHAEVTDLSLDHLERAAGFLATFDEPPPFDLFA